MNRTLKWVLGIVIGLVVIAGMVAGGLYLWNTWGGGGMMGERAFRDWDGGRNLPWGDMPMHRFDRPFGGMPGTRFFGISFLGWIFGSLLRLGFWALVVVGVVALVRAVWRSQPTSTPVQPVQTPAQVMPVEAPCPNCGFPVKEGWKHCPNCAHILSE